ncbi:DUF3267 domain-containing protein [Saccharicrinis sp. FJH2]|uniref:DUF3267 domain-containing protein n=1 Tax=Saccharicrinis sp. FJH65 TaxID=3344659 RepID=UPI0035F42859
MKSNPTVSQLDSGVEYTLIKELRFDEIKPFILKIISKRDTLINFYVLYQTIALAALIILVAFHIYNALINEAYHIQNFYCILTGLLFSFSVLVIIHELMHALAYSVLGKKQLKFGADIKKFIFYVHAHMQVVNRKELILVALIPFILVHLICIPLIIILWHSPLSLFFWVVLLAHALFCAGDFAMISFFSRQKTSEIYTYDDSRNKLARFYIKKADIE